MMIWQKVVEKIDGAPKSAKLYDEIFGQWKWAQTQRSS